MKPRNRNDSSGVSFIEILISTAIVVAVSLAIIETFLVNLNASEMNKGNTVALMHLSNMMERIKATPFSDMLTRFPSADVDGPVTNDYAAVVGGYTLDNEHITVTYVNPAADPLEMTVSLGWRYARTLDRANILVTKRTR
jgi:Tfp pilus assembly protein PilV